MLVFQLNRFSDMVTHAYFEFSTVVLVLVVGFLLALLMQLLIVSLIHLKNGVLTKFSYCKV